MSHDTRLIRAQAEANRINQFTPFGSLTFSGGPLNTTAKLNLDPETQQLVDQLGGATTSRLGQLFGGGQPLGVLRDQIGQTGSGGGGIGGGLAGLAGNLKGAIGPRAAGGGSPSGGGLLSDPFNPEVPQVGGVEGGALGPFDQSTQAQQAVFRRAQSLLEPQFERQEERLRQTLANQGLPTGSEAFNDEFGQFNRDRNRAFEEAAFRAVGAGNQRQNQLFGQGLSALGAQQGIRNQNLGEVEQLLGLRQAATPGLGQFFSPGSVDTGPDAQRQIAKQNRSSERDAAALGGLATLGAAIFSDRRLKRYIRRIGEIAGLPLYVFQYIWGGSWQIGHMADEVEKVYPDAVIRHRSGYLMVDYSQVWG